LARLRLFAGAAEAAGKTHDEMPNGTVAEILDVARSRYGSQFSAVLTTCQVWVNGEPVDLATQAVDTDEVAILPPVSGG
jgi:molybdopterin synthase sulfur carrier subunit